MLTGAFNILTMGSHISPAQIRLTWETDSISANYFEVYKDGDLVATIQKTSNINDYEYTDSNLSRNRRGDWPVYIIKEYLKNGNLSNELEINIVERFRVFEYEILRQQEYYFQHIAGAPYILFQRKRDDSIKCPICWDYTLNRPSANSRDCSLCLGTGILNPYYSPMVIWGTIPNLEGNSQRAEELYRMEQDQLILMINGVPAINPGDLVLEPTNKIYYQVDDVSIAGRPNAGVMQRIALKKTPEQKPEYKWIEIATNQIDKINEQINEILKARTF